MTAYREVDIRYLIDPRATLHYRNISEWGTVFGDAIVATAILDRLLHHSHVITIRGDS